jgi:hypothetical protein
MRNMKRALYVIWVCSSTPRSISTVCLMGIPSLFEIPRLPTDWVANFCVQDQSSKLAQKVPSNMLGSFAYWTPEILEHKFKLHAIS